MMLYQRHLIILTFLPIFLYAEHHLPTFFNPRSVSRDAARDAIDIINFINKDNNPSTVPGVLSITPEWTQTFNSNHITECLFGDNLIKSSCKPYLKISGSAVQNRSSQDLLADYFYLPVDFESIVTFKPTINNFIIDIGWFLALDSWKKGFYFWIYAPLTHTRWNLSIDETIIAPGVQGYDAGYFTPNEIKRNKLLENFTDFVNGKTINNSDTIAFQELKYAEMSNKRLIKTRVAEIRSGFGWNFYDEDNYHAGFNGQVTFPTGLRPKGNFLFEPIIGNGHFWELGCGGNAHYTFWKNQDETKKWLIYSDINLTHLFSTRQKRTFDLKSAGPFSRYMLAMEMTQSAINLLGNGVAPSAQFNNDYLPVANITTVHVNVDITLQADIVLMFNYTSNRMSYNFGYNYWAHTGENITLHAIESFAEQKFSIKGNAHTFGFEQNSNNAIALSATESHATVHTGTPNDQTNKGIDFPKLATTNPPTSPSIPINLQSTPNNIMPSDQINTSIPPVFLTYSDIDTQTAGSRDSSSKFFAHISYTGIEKHNWKPYAGIGGFVEFDHKQGTKKNNNCANSCGASQWGIWVKTGATFN